MEPILNPENSRFTIYPIKYHDIWESYKKQLASFWKAEEIDFSKDYNEFVKLSEDEQHFIKRILAFFASADGIVNWNITDRFLKDVQIIEARTAYMFQNAMESIHNETYSLMLDNIVRDKKEREMLFNSIETIPSIGKMAQWAIKWIESELSFHHRIIAFTVIEGIFFSGAFAAIYWLKKYKGNGMGGLIMSNEFIARDEGMHTEFGCLLYNLLQHRLSYEEVKSIICEGVEIAKQFMEDALPVRLIGMNESSMNQYLEYVGDRLFVSLGYSKFYNSTNPFPFMETIGMMTKSNFFETRPSQYQSASVFNQSGHNNFSITDDF